MTHFLDTNGIVPNWTVGDRVQKARNVAGFDQGAVAKEIGMSRSGIARIEQGLSSPRRTSLISIAYATGVNLDWLENGETPAPGGPGGGSECAIRESNPEPTDLGRVLPPPALLAA